MAKFDIPVIATVECDTIDEARQAVYKALETISFEDFSGLPGPKKTLLVLEMADDEDTDSENRRVIRLHPNDVDADYDKDEYLSQLIDDVTDQA
jgi:hypothetical protein